jgi:hypothetical protein
MRLHVIVGPARQLLSTCLLVVVAAGCGGTEAGQGSYFGAGTTTAPTTESAPESETESTSAQPPPTAASTESTSAAPTSAVPTTASPTGTPPPPSDELSEQGWVVGSVELRRSAFEAVEGDAQITNTADTERTALFAITLFVGEDLVASLIASVTAVPAGGTVTAPLIGFDPYVEGPYSIDLEVSFTT